SENFLQQKRCKRGKSYATLSLLHKQLRRSSGLFSTRGKLKIGFSAMTLAGSSPFVSVCDALGLEPHLIRWLNIPPPKIGYALFRKRMYYHFHSYGRWLPSIAILRIVNA